MTVEKHLSRKPDEGLSVIETLIAILILSFGLLAAAQMIYAAMGSASLARTKASAAIVAQDKLDFLSDLYRQNPAVSALTAGVHGPQRVQIVNPVDGAILNRYNIQWSVTPVLDPRPGKILPAKLVAVTVSPVDAAGNANNKVFLNKVVNVTALFSAATR